MPPKNSGTIAQQREKVNKRYKRGRAEDDLVIGTAAMTDVDRLVKQEMCCYLKAMDFSYAYMADALNVHVNTIKSWFGNEKLDMAVKVAKIRQDFVGAAMEYIKTFILEIIEIQMQIVRTTDSESLASNIGFELMDRVGLTKVNKSESISAATVRQEQTVDITDSTGMLKIIEHAPPEVQAKMAQMSADMLAMAAEHAVPVAK